MNKRSSASARALAVAALVGAFVLAIVVVAGTLGGGDSPSPATPKQSGAGRSDDSKRRAPATYEVKSGDTLVAISNRTGVPVARIEELNPQVDPQILIAGEKLKLR